MRLIDADKLIEKAKCEAIGMTDEYKDLGTIVEWLVDKIPTAKSECISGVWIECDDGWDGVYYECSNCGEAFTLLDGTPADNLYNYCPTCGADMTHKSCHNCGIYSKGLLPWQCKKCTGYSMWRAKNDDQI